MGRARRFPAEAALCLHAWTTITPTGPIGGSTRGGPTDTPAFERLGTVARGLFGVVGAAILLAGAAIRLALVLGRLRIVAGVDLLAVGLSGRHLHSPWSDRGRPAARTMPVAETPGPGGAIS